MRALWLVQVAMCALTAFGVGVAYEHPSALSVGCAAFSLLSYGSATLVITRRS